MHWINDIVLAQSNSALVTASSDLAVKVWRPHAEENDHAAQTIGEHADYVKCLATPPEDANASWVASGGLDRKIQLWDLNGGGKTLEIDVKGEEIAEKGSVYALAVRRNIIASGGPEKVVRLYDPRTGSKISKLVGHLDSIRSILIDDASNTILSASGDKTIKMWSIKGGRCMYTFTMHEESIWSLYSNDPQLGVFYSSDRSGLVTKTDVRGSFEDMDDGLSIAVAHEHTGVNRVLVSKGQIWTATSQSSINRWEDIETGQGVKLPKTLQDQRAAVIAANRPRQLDLPVGSGLTAREIPLQSVLKISNTAIFPSTNTPDSETKTTNDGSITKPMGGIMDNTEMEVKAIHHLPTETIEGQFGLVKHKLLNDRKRVLTLDTAGDVIMWDLIQVYVSFDFDSPGNKFLNRS